MSWGDRSRISGEAAAVENRPLGQPSRRTLTAHVHKHTPPGVTVEVQAAAILTELYGRQPYLTRTGASIPVCEVFLGCLGAHTVIFGLALEDENIHAPNEFFRLSSFERGETAWPLLLERLGQYSR